MLKYFKKIIIGAVLAALCIPFVAFAARTDNLWDYPSGGNYYKTNGSASGVDILISGSNHYLNWGSVSGTSGYGFRDNAGIIEFKNSGGSWTGVGSGGGSGSPAGSTGQVQFNTSGSFAADSNFFWDNTNKRLGIGSSTPSTVLSVTGTTTSDVFVAGSTTATSTFANGIRLSKGCFQLPSGSCAGTGGGTPAGANQTLQYNNAGAFGSIPNSTYNPSTGTLTLSNSDGGKFVTLSSSGIDLHDYDGVGIDLTSDGGDIVLTGAGVSVQSVLSMNSHNLNMNNALGQGVSSIHWYESGGGFAADLNGAHWTLGGSNIELNPDDQYIVMQNTGGGVRIGQEVVDTVPVGLLEVQYQDDSFGKNARLISGNAWDALDGIGTSNGSSAFYSDIYDTVPHGGVFISSYTDDDGSYYGVASMDASSTNFFMGNTGIGTKTPTTKLTVAGTTTVAVLVSTTTATSTFAGGINVTSGCVARNGTCIVPGTGAPGGSNTQVQFNSSGSFLGSTRLLWDNTNNRLSLGSTVATSSLYSGALTNFTGYNGFGIKNTSGNNVFEVSTNGVVGFFGSEAFFAMGDRVLGGGFGNTYTGGFYKYNGVFNMYNNSLGQNTMGIADNGDVIIGNNAIGLYAGTKYSSTIPYHLTVSDLRDGFGTYTDNGDGTATFSESINVQIGDVLYFPDNDCRTTITGIEDSFLADVSDDCGLADVGFQYIHGNVLYVTDGLGGDIIRATTAQLHIGGLSTNRTYFGDGTFTDLGSPGYLYTTAASGHNAGVLVNRDSTTDYASIDLISSHNPSTGWSMQMQPNSTKLSFADRVAGNDWMTVVTGGNVGLSTSTPDSKLDVKGSVRFEGASSVETASISGAIIGIGCDTSDTTGQSGLASTTSFMTTPEVFPGNGIFFYSMALSSTTIRTYVCADVTVTPNASKYVIKIIK